MADEHPKAAGIGPAAIDQAAATYFDIAMEDQRRELEAARMGRFGVEAKLPLINGAVPKMDSGPWSVGDHLGPEPALGQDINGSDPSGTLKNRGID